MNRLPQTKNNENCNGKFLIKELRIPINKSINEGLNNFIFLQKRTHNFKVF